MIFKNIFLILLISYKVNCDENIENKFQQFLNTLPIELIPLYFKNSSLELRNDKYI
jgi:hypothetical protein